MTRSACALVALLVAVTASACAHGSGVPTAPPYSAGVTTALLPYTSVEIWYPAAPASTRGRAKDTYDVRNWLPPALARRVTPATFTFVTDAYRDAPPASSAPFPLVLFAHGLYSFRDQSTFLTTWLASWGYVVAAPDFPAHDLTTFFAHQSGAPTDAQVLADTEQLVKRVLGRTVGTGKVAVIGHSQGGIDAMQFASRPEVGVYIPLAAGFAGAHPQLPAIASLYIAGGADHALPPALVRDVFNSAPSPKRLVVLARAGHLAFTDLCLVGEGHGGLAALGRQLGLVLAPGSPFTPAALDGCAPGNLSPQEGFSMIRQAVLEALHSARVG